MLRPEILSYVRIGQHRGNLVPQKGPIGGRLKGRKEIASETAFG